MFSISNRSAAEVQVRVFYINAKIGRYSSD
jgi:hypothetical protein